MSLEEPYEGFTTIKNIFIHAKFPRLDPHFSSSFALICERYTAAEHFTRQVALSAVESRAQLISLHRSVVARVPAQRPLFPYLTWGTIAHCAGDWPIASLDKSPKTGLLVR